MVLSSLRQEKLAIKKLRCCLMSVVEDTISCLQHW